MLPNQQMRKNGRLYKNWLPACKVAPLQGMQVSNIPRVYLRKKIGNRIENGHPWIFANEIDTGKTYSQSDAVALTPGAIVDVFNGFDKFIGRGYFNRSSQIIVRLLTRKPNIIINEDFFYQKIAYAWQYRQKLGYTENCRLIFGEADGLPAWLLISSTTILYCKPLRLVWICGSQPL